jgi:hypothetical protein
MKTVLDTTTRHEIIDRINALDENAPAQWGTMDVGQMMKHCSQWDEMALGKKTYKRSFIGRLFGRIALKDMLKDAPIKRNLPTVPSFKIIEKVDASEERKRWVRLVEEYADYSDAGFVHPFFGQLTREQVGVIVYKHTDHHLRQFNG